jgi:hypothetical protein
LLTGLALSIIITATGSAAKGSRMRTASISGPITVTRQSGEPFRGTNEQPVPGPGLPLPVLAPYGYVEEEYFVSGTVDGKPYKTSILVRKPGDPRKFSGLVAIETVHAAGAVPFWGRRDLWMSGGHGYVAVASQRVALETQVKEVNPARYALLNIPEMEPLKPWASGALTGGAQDKVSQAIMTQVGALLKANRKDGPFARMRVKYLIMGGASQTGGTTARYIQESHAAARLAGGKPIYDGYSVLGIFSDKPIIGGDAPVLHAVSEGDLMFFPSRGQIIYSRPDADAPNDRYRHFQITGGSHLSTRGATNPKTVFPTLPDNGPNEQLSQFPLSPLYETAMRHLVEWVMRGVAPPRAPRIEIKDGVIVRDENGIAKGGVRSPYVDTPTVRYIAAQPINASNPLGALVGLQEPFPAEKLRALYKSRGNYLELFNQGIDRMIAGRWITPADGIKLKAEEAKQAPQF